MVNGSHKVNSFGELDHTIFPGVFKYVLLMILVHIEIPPSPKFVSDTMVKKS